MDAHWQRTRRYVRRVARLLVERALRSSRLPGPLKLWMLRVLLRRRISASSHVGPSVRIENWNLVLHNDSSIPRGTVIRGMATVEFGRSISEMPAVIDTLSIVSSDELSIHIPLRFGVGSI